MQAFENYASIIGIYGHNFENFRAHSYSKLTFITTPGYILWTGKGLINQLVPTFESEHIGQKISIIYLPLVRNDNDHNILL